MNERAFRYFCVNKPFGMLSQFSKIGDERTLADLAFAFPKDVYPLGRLDTDSEGLLLITNDKAVNNKLLDPRNQHKRIYFVQVEREIDPESCIKISEGVEIKVDGVTYKTKPSEVERIAQPEWLPERNPPIRFRKTVPTSWIKLTLTEGKNRQVRKMTAAAGFPTLRLIRYAIGEIDIMDIAASTVKEVSQKDFYKKLSLK